jgi:CRP/FNR family transcriptional regulator
MIKPQHALDKIAALRRTELFQGLPDSVIAELASRAMVRQLPEGEVLFSEHDSVSGLYVVVDGELRNVRQNAKGREQVIATERAGAVLAAAPIFDGGKYYSTAIADRPTQVLCIPTHDMHEICHSHPDLLWSLAKVFAHKIRHLTELVETLALRNVDQRVAQYIFTLCREQGSTDSDTCAVDISMTQAEMASRIGSTREVVCRAISHLEEQNLIEALGTRRFKVVSVSRLGSFAGVHLELEDPRLISELSTQIA